MYNYHLPNAKRRSVALRSIASRSFWRYHEWRERERDKSAAAAAAVSDGESTWAMDGRVAGVSDLPTLRHHSSQRPNPHVSHCNISSSSFFVSYDFVFSKFFFSSSSSLLRLELQRDNHMQYVSKGLRHLSSAFSVLDAKWVSLSLSLSHTHTHTHTVFLLFESIAIFCYCFFFWIELKCCGLTQSTLALLLDLPLHCFVGRIRRWWTRR